jgi:hypothetical protein
MFVSFNDGAQWQPLQQNLPMTSVRDIDVHRDDLVIATHGRGFWIMDNITALRQMNLAQAAHGAVLFKPATAIRERPAGFTGTPLPKDEPMAADPLLGADIDYALPADTTGVVTLTIFDAKNRKVQSYTSATKAVAPDAAKLAFAPEWVPPQQLLSAAPGMHRFVWDVHYSGAGNPQNPFAAGGVWAPPGNYAIELRAGGQTLRQALVLKPDPRVKLVPAAFQREFALTMDVQNASAQIAAALKEASGLLKALEDREAHETRLRPQIEQAMSDISALSDIPLPADTRPGRENPPLRTDSLQSLAADFGKLKQAVDGADADPGADSLAAYAALSKTLADTLHAWQQMKEKDLAALNAGFKTEGEGPLAAPIVARN